MTATSSSSPPMSGLLVLEQPPACVFQTVFDGDRQDSSTPLTLRLTVADANVLSCLLSSVRDAGSSSRAGKKPSGDISSLLTTTLRRFDGEPLRQYNPDTRAMERLTLTPATFSAFLHGEGGEVSVQVHRKHLPVSSCFGDAPFCFAFVLTVPGAQRTLVTSTQPFTCCSKEPKRAPVARPPPKRERGTPAAKPVTVPDVDASLADKAMHDFFAAGGAVPPSAASDGEDAAPARAGVKRRSPEEPAREAVEPEVRPVRARMAPEAALPQVLPGLEPQEDEDDDAMGVWPPAAVAAAAPPMLGMHRGFSMSGDAPLPSPKPSPLFAALHAGRAFEDAIAGTTLEMMLRSISPLL